MEKDICVAENILKEHNLKITEQRNEILSIILSLNIPFTALEIKNLLKIDADFATVYRFLNILHEEKVIREVCNTDGTQYFELSCIHNPNHPHFICKNCKTVYCMKNAQSINDKIKNDNFISQDLTVDEISVTIGGICQKCNSKK